MNGDANHEVQCLKIANLRLDPGSFDCRLRVCFNLLVRFILNPLVTLKNQELSLATSSYSDDWKLVIRVYVD